MIYLCKTIYIRLYHNSSIITSTKVTFHDFLVILEMLPKHYIYSDLWSRFESLIAIKRLNNSFLEIFSLKIDLVNQNISSK